MSETNKRLKKYRPDTQVARIRCQHPTSRRPGQCRNDAIGLFDIPDDYNDARRHAESPHLPRPVAHLCLQHSSKVDGKPVADAGSHEAQCPVCRHPDGKRMMKDWVSWLVGSAQVMAELGVSERSFYGHIHHFDLLAKKSSRVNTMRALVLAAEKGLSSPDGHNPKTGIDALRQLSRERGDVQQMEMDVRVAHLDLTRMTDSELAAHAQQLAQQLAGSSLREAESGGAEQVIEGSVRSGGG